MDLTPETMDDEMYYLEKPKERMFYMIDLSWDERPDLDGFGSRFSVNLEDGKKKNLEIKELESTRKRLRNLGKR